MTLQENSGRAEAKPPAVWLPPDVWVVTTIARHGWTPPFNRAFLRAYYYGALSNVVLNYGVPSNVLVKGIPRQLLQFCPSVNTITSLNDYWTCVTNAAITTNWLVGVLGIGSWVESISISWAVGFLSAVAVASYLAVTDSIEGFKNDFDDTFARLPSPLKVAFWGAFIDYWLELTIVQWLSRTQVGGTPIVVISLVLSFIIASVFVRSKGGNLSTNKLQEFFKKKKNHLAAAADSTRS